MEIMGSEKVPYCTHNEYGGNQGVNTLSTGLETHFPGTHSVLDFAKLCRPHIGRRGTSVDEYGRHGLSCKFGGGRYSRHSALNESLKRAQTPAQIPAILEPQGSLGPTRDAQTA
ncbi:hypothetical protein RvY_11215 [Ramazzottius varieornatus]|uniref:Uncharacterized protein n=1 Tax=Ramazzottius varieornatus TaxID=947166 RepID=A0A1D1VFE6_RAMVA|nr:hypothetical protein RvY_11215 [Ramazzottius varieornatus]